MSHPTDDDWKRISKMVDLIYQRPDAEPFREPVPWKVLGLIDYPTIITYPMDLGTIKEKLRKKQYKTIWSVNDDIRTVWSNCMTYNADGSDFYKLAELLKLKWDDKYKKLVSDISSATTTNTVSDDKQQQQQQQSTSGDTNRNSDNTNNNTNNKSSLSDKRNFAKLLYQISKEDLGKVLLDVEAKHPAAIKRNATEDEVVLNIDEIPSQLLHELHTTIITNTNTNTTTTSKSNTSKSNSNTNDKSTTSKKNKSSSNNNSGGTGTGTSTGSGTNTNTNTTSTTTTQGTTGSSTKNKKAKT